MKNLLILSIASLITTSALAAPMKDSGFKCWSMLKTPSGERVNTTVSVPVQLSATEIQLAEITYKGIRYQAAAYVGPGFLSITGERYVGPVSGPVAGPASADTPGWEILASSKSFTTSKKNGDLYTSDLSGLSSGQLEAMLDSVIVHVNCTNIDQLQITF